MKQTTSAGGVIVNKRGLVLVVAQQDGLSWSLPKGHIEDGEDAQTAAVREIEEESGISDVKLVREMGTYQRYNLKPTDPENPEAKWVKPDEVSKMLTHPKDKAFFEQQKEQILQFIASRDFI